MLEGSLYVYSSTTIGDVRSRTLPSEFEPYDDLHALRALLLVPQQQ